MGPRNDAGAPIVSEPNLKLRYKPKKSLERRKNPLLRKESAPPSLRRRPAETLGGEGPGGPGAGRVTGSLPQGYHRCTLARDEPEEGPSESVQRPGDS